MCRCPLVPNSLGMSETFGPHSGELDGVVLAEDRANSFGRAINGIERKIVDPQGAAELPPGEVGELLVRGYSVMQGYYKREREECFEPDGFFRTGDLCAITEDGHLFFHGRGGEMIKTSGAQRLAPGGGTRADGVPGSRRGRGARPTRPARWGNRGGRVVPQPEAQLDPQRLRERLDAELSSYKIPKLFITDLQGEELPEPTAARCRSTHCWR